MLVHCRVVLFAFASVSSVSVAVTAFHVIIGDSALGFLHAGSQFANAVADTYAESLLDALRPHVGMEKAVLHSGVVFLVFFQEVGGRKRDVEAIFQQRLLDAQAVAAVTAALALKAYARRQGKDIK